MRTSKGETGNEVSAVSELNSIEGINMEEINEAFEIHGKSADQQNDRFNSYYEDPCDMNEDESDVSYDLETESELEVCDDGGSFDQITIEDDGNLLDVLGEGGSFASLKAVFEALVGKTALKSYSELNQTTFVATEGCSDQLSGSTRKKGGEKMVCLLVHCVLPLYAMLPAAAQLRVFEEVKEGERLVVISTNVAETSLTIQGIKYVVDTGREKVKNYSSNNGMETYEVQWISKASLLYMQEEPEELHLATVTVFILLQSLITYFLTFEISKIHGDGVVLLLKSMGIDKVANFPFPTPPWTTALVEAERCLKALEALDSSGRLTPLGRSMAHYPMSPRHSRMLLTVNQIARKLTGYARANLVLGYAVAAAAALSLSNPFVLQFEGSHTNSDDLQKDEKFGTQDSKKK